MEEFFSRRKKLASLMKPSSIAILIGSKVQYRNSDVEYPFRQNSDVYYLSGIEEPEITLILQKDKNNKVQYIVFYKSIDKKTSIWFGPGLTAKQIVKDYGANYAYKKEELNSKITKLLSNKKNIYYSFGINECFDKKIINWLNLKSQSISYNKKIKNHIFYDLRIYLSEMRIIKSKTEIQNITRAANLSAMAHNQLMKYCKIGLKEYQIAAKFNYIVQNKGSERLAYPIIVGGGNNACILHYSKNNCELKKGQLVLVDAGCEYNYYASDITRTYPVSGKFSAMQKDLYQLVLTAQKTGISLIKPNVSWGDVHEKIIEIIVDGLIDLKILKGSKKSILKNEKYKNFYLHGFGHFLGLDVHDVGKSKANNKWIKFKPGMVLTIEPGIYISSDNKNAPLKWRGMGVRIEDNILVTAKGNKNLTKKAVKEIEEIESLML